VVFLRSCDPPSRLVIQGRRRLGHGILTWLTIFMGTSLPRALADDSFPGLSMFAIQPVPHVLPNARAVAVSPNGTLVAAASLDAARNDGESDAGRIVIWEMATGRLVRSIETRGDVIQLRFSADGRSLVYGSVRTLGDATDEEATVVHTLDGSASLSRFPASAVFAVSPEDGGMLLADRASLCLRFKLPDTDDPVPMPGPDGGTLAEALAYASDGGAFAAVYRTREPVDVSPGGSTRTLLRLRGLVIVDSTSMEPTALTRSDALADCSSLDVAKDGSLVATGHDDGAVRLWKGSTLEPLGTIEGQAGWPALATFNPDGTELAVLTQPLAAGDGIQPCQLTFYRVPGLEPLRRIEFVDGAFTTSHARRDRAALNPRRLAYLPGGDAVVVGVGGVSLVDSATGAVTRAFDAEHSLTGETAP